MPELMPPEFIPVEQARTFVRLLREAEAPLVAYAELPQAQHAFDVLPSVRAWVCADATEWVRQSVALFERKAG